MPNSGLTSTTVHRLGMGPAVVYRAGVIIGTLGASATAEEVVEYRQPRIAGLSIPVEGLDRAVSRTLRVTGEFLEHSALESVKWTAGVNASGNVTPIDAGVLFGAAHYDDDIRFRMILGNGDEFRARMLSGIVTGFPFSSQDPGEGASTVTWEARSLYSSPDDAPYTYEFAEAGGNPDAVTALITALGGDSVVKAIYCTTDGVTGDAHGSVVNSSGVVDSWQDYRHPTNFAPPIAFAGTARPAWDAGLKLITFDGVDDTGSTGASAVFNLLGARCLVIVATRTAGLNYVASIDGAGPTRWMAVDASGGTWKGEIGGSFQSVSTTVAADGTRRVVIVSQDAGSNKKAVVPNQAQGSIGTGGDNGAGDNNLTLGKNPSAGQFSACTFKLVLFMTIDPDATQRNLIRDLAINLLGAVAA